VSRLSRKCEVFDVLQTCGPPWPLIWIALPFFFNAHHYFSDTQYLTNRQTSLTNAVGKNERCFVPSVLHHKYLSRPNSYLSWPNALLPVRPSVSLSLRVKQVPKNWTSFHENSYVRILQNFIDVFHFWVLSIYLSIYLSFNIDLSIYSGCSHLEHKASVKRFISLHVRPLPTQDNTNKE
jgi:hypothetical protein